MATENNKLASIKDEDWYQSIVLDCQAVLTERIWNSNSELIIGYGEIGERIFNDENYQKYSKGNRDFNRKLFEDIGIGERNGYYCLQFYEKFIYQKFNDVCTGVQSLPEGKNISWNKIKIHYLPDNIQPQQATKELPQGQFNGLYKEMQITQKIKCPCKLWDVYDKDEMGKPHDILKPEIELKNKVHECEKLQVFQSGLKRYYLVKRERNN